MPVWILLDRQGDAGSSDISSSPNWLAKTLISFLPIWDSIKGCLTKEFSAAFKPGLKSFKSNKININFEKGLNAAIKRSKEISNEY